MTVYVHDPQARLDYAQDWSPWLTDVSDSIASAVWSCTDPGVVLVSVDGSAAAGKPRVWVSGATEDTRVKLTCHVVTAAGRQDDRTDILQVRQR